VPSLAADYDALAGAAAKLGALSDDLGDQAGPIRAALDAAAGAAGQFGSQLQRGTATFGLSWHAATEVFATSAQTLSSNVDQVGVVLSGIDNELGATMDPP
jgi:ABC-type transporter Mla subunit MlaD